MVDEDRRAEQQARALYAGDRASQQAGIALVAAGPGWATATMTVGPAHVNGNGHCHGGYLFLLADSAFGFACNTRGMNAVAAGGDVTFLAPVLEGDALVAEARERVLRGRSGLYDITVRRGDEPVCELRGRSRAVSTYTADTTQTGGE